MATRIVTATEFKSNLPSILDEIEHQGGPITITRGGRPVAELRPARKKSLKPLMGSWEGRGKVIGDIVNTDDLTDLWECVNPK